MPKEPQSPQHTGERSIATWNFRFLESRPIEKGEMIIPVRIQSEAAREFAALHLIHNDLSFARDCLEAADEFGRPDIENVQARALISSGVVAYARPFKTGVRPIRLEPDFFAGMDKPFDHDVHNYLVDIRDKHIAHSVNAFERCEPVGVVIGTSQTGWRDGRGIGVTTTQFIGVSRELVRAAIGHITTMISYLATRIEKQRIDLGNEFSSTFAKDQKWEMAPVIVLPEKKAVSARRSD